MTEPNSDLAFEQPLAELPVRGYEGDETDSFTLRLTATTLALVPDAATAERIRRGFAAGEEGLESAPGFIRGLVSRMLRVGMQGIEEAFRPHSLADTALTLGGPYLHVRIGHFDGEYGPGEVDPDAAARFVAAYQTARQMLDR
jgi:hypothetical protein